MRQGQRFSRGAVLASSIVLVGLYVYDRAGGNIFRRHSVSPAPAIEAESPTLLPGSKSAGVWAPSDERPASPPGTVRRVDPVYTQAPTLLPGSKSAVIIDLPDAPMPRANEAASAHAPAATRVSDDPFGDDLPEPLIPTDDSHAGPENLFDLPAEESPNDAPSVAEDDPFNPQ